MTALRIGKKFLQMKIPIGNLSAKLKNSSQNSINNPVLKMGQRSKWTFLQRRHTGGHKAKEKMLNITNSLLLVP